MDIPDPDDHQSRRNTYIVKVSLKLWKIRDVRLEEPARENQKLQLINT